MTNQQYEEFLKSKVVTVMTSGFTVEKEDINNILFPFQRDIVKWALWKGKSAIFAECGLGKTVMQLEWARLVHEHTGNPTLIVAPLAVAAQTVKEGKTLLDMDVQYCRSDEDATGKINITNYEMLSKFDLNRYGGIVIDESSILKSFTGKTKRLLVEMAQDVDYRLACTATPAPNDHLELGNHAEFLGIMRSREMIQRWFINDSMKAGGYRLLKHGEDSFWSWVASWAVALRWPSDIGNYDDKGYILPELIFDGHIIPVDHSRAWDEVDKSGQASLLITGRTSATNMFKEKRATLKRRMKKAAELARDAAKNDYVIVWCETNREADELKKMLPESVEIRGSESITKKREKLEAFSACEHRILVTKPKIAAHGLNWQHAGTQVWTSITHKFESFYQGYKRSHRFGRNEPVKCHIVYAESEGDILENLNRKQVLHEKMQDAMVESMQKNGMALDTGHRLRVLSTNSVYESGDNWRLYNGDSALAMNQEEKDSLDFIVQSPPFESLYIYSDHVEDLGNSANNSEFYNQYGFILSDELRRLKQGAYKAEHCKDLPLYSNRDGAMGLDDFPGRLIKAHVNAGYWFVGWKTIWKDPVIEMQRTKNAGLLWSSAFCQRAERARQGMADYVLIFQKPIDDEKKPETGVERTPVPSSVVSRCVDLWTNNGENILSPYHAVDKKKEYDFVFLDEVPESINKLANQLREGRNIAIRVTDPAVMQELISRMRWNGVEGLVFHSRVALTDGTWIVVFRKWVAEMPSNSHVIHDLDPSTHKFIGNMPPIHWDSARDYSIQTWQRYASPVWFDLDGIPSSHDDIWFDINQTNVINHRIARENKDEKHICPLQIDLIEKCIAQYTQDGDTVGTSFAGVGSELVTAVKMNRRAVGCELKKSYFDLACTHLRQVELELKTPTLFNFANINID